MFLGSISDAGSEAINGMPWLRGEASEQGFNSINFQSVGMLPWMQQRFDPTGLRNDLNQQYQAMLAAGLQNYGSGELLKHQLMPFQQPVHYLQHSGSQNPQSQQQHIIQPSVSSLTLPLQTQMLSDNMQRPMQQQVDNQSEEHLQHHTYQEAYLEQHDQLQRRHPSDIPSPSFTKSEFPNSQIKFPASMAHSSVQNMLGNHLNLSSVGQAMLDEQSPQHSWVAKFAQTPVSGGPNSKLLPPYSGKDASVEQETCSLDVQNHSLFGANIDSSGLLLPTTVSRVVTSSVQADMFPMPLGSSGYQSPLYGYVQDSSELLHNTGQVDQSTLTRTYVKVAVRDFVFYCT